MAEGLVAAGHVSQGWRVRFQFEPRDFWVGVFYTGREQVGPVFPLRWGGVHTWERRRWFVCLVPCLPLVIERVHPEQYHYDRYPLDPNGERWQQRLSLEGNDREDSP